jgi:hypothetical protein
MQTPSRAIIIEGANRLKLEDYGASLQPTKSKRITTAMHRFAACRRHASGTYGLRIATNANFAPKIRVTKTIWKLAAVSVAIRIAVANRSAASKL